MKNKLIIGGIFCCVLLCVMPMVSTVELKTIEKTQGNKINTQSESIFFNKIGDLIKKGTLPKHLILWITIVIQINFRFLRSVFLLILSIGLIHGNPGIKHPLMFLRSLWLLITLIIESYFWGKVQDSLGWNWQGFLGWYWPGLPQHSFGQKTF